MNAPYDQPGADFRSAADEKGDMQRRRRREHATSLNVRPTFGQWLRATWLDFVTMCFIAGVTLAFYLIPPLSTRYFPVHFSNGEIVYATLAYPYLTPVFSSLAAGLLCALVPAATILLCQLRVRSFWDANNALLGLIYALLSSSCFQVIVKTCIGGLRPHFLSVCKPDPNRMGSGHGGTGFDGIMYTREICTGDRARINNALVSFPSGHGTVALSGLGFLFLYLNAKLKTISNHSPAYWKIVLTFAPLLGAALLAGTLTLGEHHHGYDVLAGAVIGGVWALVGYRVMFAAVWDWRWNHVPLRRDVAFWYGADEGYGGGGVGRRGGGDLWRGFDDAVWTRQAGWGGRTGGRGEGDAVMGAGGGGLASGAETGHGGGDGARHGNCPVRRPTTDGYSQSGGRRGDEMV